MAVTFLDPVRTGADSYRLTWSSDVSDLVYRVYRGGVLLRRTKTNSLVVTMGAAGDHAEIEVLDDATTPPAMAGAPTALLAFDEVSDANQYRIEEYVAAAWVTRTIKKAGQVRHEVPTTPLVGAVATQFKVTPINAAGNDGTPLSTTVTAPRHPAPPNVSYVYNDTPNTVTISAAA